MHRDATQGRLRVKFFAALLFSLLLFVSPATAQDKTHLLYDLVIEAGQSADDITCIGCTIRVRGNVSVDATALGGNIVVDGHVAGDVVAIGGSVRLGPRATVEGDAVAIGGPIIRDSQAVIKGDPDNLPWFYWPGQRQPYWRGVLALLAFQFGLLFVFYLAARRRRVLNMTATLQHRPWWSLLAGFLMLAALGGVFYLIVMASIWNPWWGRYEGLLFKLLAAVAVILLGFGYAGLGCRLGRALRMRSGALAGLIGEAPLPATMAGTLLIIILELVPVLGTLAFLIFAMLAVGTTLVSVFGCFPRGTVGAEAP
jgi:hypothetical protein